MANPKNVRQAESNYHKAVGREHNSLSSQQAGSTQMPGASAQEEPLLECVGGTEETVGVGTES